MQGKFMERQKIFLMCAIERNEYENAERLTYKFSLRT